MIIHQIWICGVHVLSTSVILNSHQLSVNQLLYITGADNSSLQPELGLSGAPGIVTDLADIWCSYCRQIGHHRCIQRFCIWSLPLRKLKRLTRLTCKVKFDSNFFDPIVDLLWLEQNIKDVILNVYTVCHSCTYERFPWAKKCMMHREVSKVILCWIKSID